MILIFESSHMNSSVYKAIVCKCSHCIVKTNSEHCEEIKQCLEKVPVVLMRPSKNWDWGDHSKCFHTGSRTILFFIPDVTACL